MHRSRLQNVRMNRLALSAGITLLMTAAPLSAQTKETVDRAMRMVEGVRRDSTLGDRTLAKLIAINIDNLVATKQVDDGVLAVLVKYADERLVNPLMQQMAEISAMSCENTKMEGGKAWCELKAARAKEVYQLMQKARNK